MEWMLAVASRASSTKGGDVSSTRTASDISELYPSSATCARTYSRLPRAQASCSYMEAGAVVELSDATFLQMLQEGGTWIVMFYAPWCTHCMQAKPAYEQAALEYAQVALRVGESASDTS
eukprot:749337-Hanusia_phi.AAC.6